MLCDEPKCCCGIVELLKILRHGSLRIPFGVFSLVCFLEKF